MTNSSASRLVLPPRPPELDRGTNEVAAWRGEVVIDTYEPQAPSAYPMFFGGRVYQGASGRVYPLPFVERISENKHARAWDAFHLENKYLRILVLPEIGGRLHVAFDKTSGYDLFYRQDVIKPALVGLAGPWISGGVEFNWPQHHRPATFMPVDVEIEHAADGSVTVWCSDHDPFLRMKGMHGLTLHPDSSVLELKVRLYNRTEERQSFLWWANAAARVHDDYQAFFPTDVDHVFDHAKRAASTYPRADGTYYGIDYPARVSEAQPDADRLDWYRNIPVPTSYMCVDTDDDFLGGYDHDAGAGFVHWADHQIAPGKKLWTWGNGPFGEAWERNLTDDGGPYVELMAGVYSDNQPDFSFLQPGETRSFSQYWYPITQIGPVHQATTDVAVHLATERAASSVAVGVCVTSPRDGVHIQVTASDRQIGEWTVDLAPGRPFTARVPLAEPISDEMLGISITHEGVSLMEWRRRPRGSASPPALAVEPPSPELVGSVEQLYLIGTHLQQNHHATRDPEPYWRHALEIDAGDSRTHVALSALRYNEGRYDAAIEHAQAAIRRLTERNPNPPTGLAHYRLGLAASRIGNRSLAHDAFCKAAWNGELSSAALLAAAQIDASEARYDAALERIDGSLSSNAQNLQAQDLRALVLARLGKRSEVQPHGSSLLKRDALDWWARDILGQQLDCDSKTCLDIAASYAVAGFRSEALRVLGRADEIAARELYSGTRPLIAYRRAALFEAMGDVERARQAVGVAESLPVAYCFPWLLDDYDALVVARSLAPNDLNAGYLLGTWLYAHGRRHDALEVWQSVAASGSKEPLLWRNIGLAVVNTDGDLALALDHYDHALELAPSDHRLLFERDQLIQRCGYSPAQRLSTLQAFPESVSARDDLTIELADLLTDTGSATQALEILQSRQFQPWEGGEGKVLATWERTLVSLSRRELLAGSPATAHRLIQLAFEPPTNLGEARHPLASMARLWLCLGDIYAAEHRTVEATEAWRHAAEHHGDFREMAVDGYGETTAYSVVAYERLGETANAGRLVEQLESYTDAFAQQRAGVDYFATSLPRQRLFAEDLAAVREQRAQVLRAEIEWCRGNHEAARARLDAVLTRDANARVVRDLLDWFDFEENRTTTPA